MSIQGLRCQRISEISFHLETSRYDPYPKALFCGLGNLKCTVFGTTENRVLLNVRRDRWQPYNADIHVAPTHLKILLIRANQILPLSIPSRALLSIVAYYILCSQWWARISRGVSITYMNVDCQNHFNRSIFGNRKSSLWNWPLWRDCSLLGYSSSLFLLWVPNRYPLEPTACTTHRQYWRHAHYARRRWKQVDWQIHINIRYLWMNSLGQLTALGAGSRRFKSVRPDHYLLVITGTYETLILTGIGVFSYFVPFYNAGQFVGIVE